MKLAGRVLVVIILLIALVFGVYLFAVARVLTLPEPVTVAIPNTGTVGAVNALWDAQVIPSRWAFVIHLFFTGKRTDIHAGQYTFKDQVTMSQVLKMITQPQLYQPEVTITLLEGWSNDEMANYLGKQNVVDPAAFLAATLVPPAQYDFLVDKPADNNLQGFLFPDTYRIFEGETPAGIVKKLLDNFNSKFTDKMKQDLAAQHRTMYDAVILASIVEKEARTAEDKKMVAGIFWKRIDNGKRLESDVTVNYITKKTTNPTASDLSIESAYNTYRNAGLPPGPLCNPGLDAINAVIYPTESNYWYFLATPDGEIKYSETYDQHLAFKHQYYD